MSKKLIITADDFGVAEGVNNGIVECYAKGTITDISIFAVGDAFEHAVRRAKENNINKIGIHLALTGSFKSITSTEYIPSLVDEDGNFPRSYGIFLAKYFTGFVSKDEIRAEFKNQISKVKKAGFTITHLNSHQHLHIVPGILNVVIKLMKEENIKYVRFPLEDLRIVDKFMVPRTWLRNFLLSSMCKSSYRLLNTSGVDYNDYFIGHAHALRLRRKDLVFAISNIKDGLTELGCHLGYFTEDVERDYPYYRNCEEELKILCDASFSDEIKRHSIELVSCGADDRR